MTRKPPSAPALLVPWRRRDWIPVMMILGGSALFTYLILVVGFWGGWTP